MSSGVISNGILSSELSSSFWLFFFSSLFGLCPVKLFDKYRIKFSRQVEQIDFLRILYLSNKYRFFSFSSSVNLLRGRVRINGLKNVSPKHSSFQTTTFAHRTEWRKIKTFFFFPSLTSGRRNQQRLAHQKFTIEKIRIVKLFFSYSLRYLHRQIRLL